jgi:transcriptional regulator with XRE-family HTH domain
MSRPKLISTFGRKLRKHRESLGWTQEELARRIGLKREEVNKIENGYNKATSARIQAALRLGLGHGTFAVLFNGKRKMTSRSPMPPPRAMVQSWFREYLEEYGYEYDERSFVHFVIAQLCLDERGGGADALAAFLREEADRVDLMGREK